MLLVDARANVPAERGGYFLFYQLGASESRRATRVKSMDTPRLCERGERDFVAAAGALGLSPGVPAANDLNRVSTYVRKRFKGGPFTVPNTAL
jgi:hypothetical protein